MTAPPSPEQLHSFYANPAIGSLADIPRWTVSSAKKVPIDFVQLIRAWEGTLPGDEFAIRGAKYRDQRCLVDLDTITTRLPDAANHAYYMDASIDGYAVLDIEPRCPDQLAQQLISSMPALMVEESMSGRGYHVLLKLPESFEDYPHATGKTVLKDPEGRYEILLNHWVTFTRRTLPLPRQPSQQAWEDLYRSLAEQARPSPKAELDVSADRPALPHQQLLLRQITDMVPHKRPADFNHDLSRYEFSVLGQLYRRTVMIISNTKYQTRTQYTAEQRAWLVYLAALEVLEHRAKHDGYRNGIPYLLQRAMDMIAIQEVVTEEPTSSVR